MDASPHPRAHMHTDTPHKRLCSDIELCKIARQQIVQARASHSRGWRLALALHSDFRIMLAIFVVISVPFLITHHGSDALNVCMNSVCLLFILEVRLCEGAKV